MITSAPFSRSLFDNLVANSDQMFLPIDIFPLQDLVLDVFPETIHPPNAGEARHCKKRNRSPRHQESSPAPSQISNSALTKPPNLCALNPQRSTATSARRSF